MGRIGYKKLQAMMKKKGLTTYRIEKEKILGQRTLQNIREGGNINTKTIAKLCEELDCQPGDILEYLKDEEEKT